MKNYIEGEIVSELSDTLSNLIVSSDSFDVTKAGNVNRTEQVNKVRDKKDVQKTTNENNVIEGLELPSDSYKEAAFTIRFEQILNEACKQTISEDDIKNIIQRLQTTTTEGDELTKELMIGELEKLKESNSAKKKSLIKLLIYYLQDQYENFQKAMGEYNRLRTNIGARYE